MTGYQSSSKAGWAFLEMLLPLLLLTAVETSQCIPLPILPQLLRVLVFALAVSGVHASQADVSVGFALASFLAPSVRTSRAGSIERRPGRLLRLSVRVCIFLEGRTALHLSTTLLCIHVIRICAYIILPHVCARTSLRRRWPTRVSAVGTEYPSFPSIKPWLDLLLDCHGIRNSGGSSSHTSNGLFPSFRLFFALPVYGFTFVLGQKAIIQPASWTRSSLFAASSYITAIIIEARKIKKQPSPHRINQQTTSLTPLFA